MSFPPSQIHLGDYHYYLKRNGNHWIITKDGTTNAGPAGWTYEDQEKAEYALYCLMATDMTLTHSDRFHALQKLLKLTNVGVS